MKDASITWGVGASRRVGVHSRPTYDLVRDPQP
jgi:hypothetical protein